MIEVIPVSRKLMAEQGLSPREYASCAEPNKALGIIGCGEYHRCRLPEKAQGLGPFNVGTTEVKRDEKGRPMLSYHIRSCFHCPHRAAELALNNGTLKITHREGDKIKQRGSRPGTTMKPGAVVPEAQDFFEDVVIPPYRDQEDGDLLNRAAARDAFEKLSPEEADRVQEDLIREATAPVSGRVGKGSRRDG